MAFKRVIDFQVGYNQGTNLLVSDLDMSFEIERSFKIENNTAKFIVYNAKEETRNKILTTDNNVIFKAGYEDEGNIGIIFSGIINDSFSKKENTDWITEITATDFGANSENLLKEMINVNYGKDTAMLSIINDLRGTLGVPLSGSENVSFSLSGGYSYTGSIRGMVKEIEEILKVNGVGLYFDNTEMVLYLTGQQNSSFGVVRITADSGLIGAIEKIKDQNYAVGTDRYKLKTLLNPELKPNKLININTKKVKGLFILENIKFYGDNFGGEFFSEFEVIE